MSKNSGRRRRGGEVPNSLWAGAALAAILLALPAAGWAAPAAHQFALIVNGDDSFTHNENVALALAALPRLGYAPADTLALAPPAGVAGAGGYLDGGDAGAASAVAAPIWRRDASDEGLRLAVARLHERMQPGDVLLVYLTGHAYRAFGRTVLALRHGTITSGELMQRIATLPFGKLILVADPCYSGGFVSAAVALARNVVAVSSTDEHHEVRCEPFVRPFWLAAMGSGGSPASSSDTAAGHGGAPPATSVEAAFQITTSLRHPAGDAPQYAATGACAGHPNSFAGGAADGPAAAGAPPATAPSSPATTNAGGQ